MLDVDDYKKYETNHRKRSTASKFFLSRWGYYEQNATRLDPWKKDNAKILYETLTHLTKEERLFLANKYRTERYKNDKIAAEECGMKKKDYAKLRIGIELKFFYYLKQLEGVAL